MEPIAHTYFGWLRFTHDSDCRRPQWEVDYRLDDSTLRLPKGHSCPELDCTHHDYYDRLEVRLICRSCTRAFKITGEEHSWAGTNTGVLGYGQAPKKAAGLWLYPGEPLIQELDAEPYEYLVSAKHTEDLQHEDVIGTIRRARTNRGKWFFEASTHPVLHAEHRTQPFLWNTRSTGQLGTTTAAAKWIAARQQQQEGTDS